MFIDRRRSSQCCSRRGQAAHARCERASAALSLDSGAGGAGHASFEGPTARPRKMAGASTKLPRSARVRRPRLACEHLPEAPRRTVDTHAPGLNPEPFERERIDGGILRYLMEEQLCRSECDSWLPIQSVKLRCENAVKAQELRLHGVEPRTFLQSPDGNVFPPCTRSRSTTLSRTALLGTFPPVF